MKLYDVYPLFDINIVKGQGCKVWDDKGQEYLDLYGGHAVISIGHCHPHYVEMLTNQLNNLGFYSNSVTISAFPNAMADLNCRVKLPSFGPTVGAQRVTAERQTSG